MAFGFSLNSSVNDNGTASLFNGNGDDPVVTMQIPTIDSAVTPLVNIADLIVNSIPSIWSNGCWRN